jgi:hypothetical protein
MIRKALFPSKILPICMAAMMVYSFNPSQAQSSIELSGGIRAGWQNAGMYRNGTQYESTLSAWYIGFYSEAQFTDMEKWSTGSSIEYFQNGFSEDGKDFKMHTLSWPMYIKRNFGPLFGTAGLALNFKLTDNREDFPNQVVDTKFFDIPLSLGFGVELGKFTLDARHYWGMFQAATLDGLGHKNRYWQIGAALEL